MDMEELEVISYTLECDPVPIDAMYLTPMKLPRFSIQQPWPRGRASNSSGFDVHKLTPQEVLMPGRHSGPKFDFGIILSFKC